MAGEEDSQDQKPEGGEATARSAPKRSRPPVTIDLEARVVDQRPEEPSADAEAPAAAPAAEDGAAGVAESPSAVPAGESTTPEPTQSGTESDAPTPDQLPPPARTPARPGFGGNWSGYALAGIAGGVMVFLLGYGLIAAGIVSGPDRKVAEQALAGVDATRVAVTDAGARLDALEKARTADADGLKALGEKAATLESAANDLAARVDALDRTDADLKTRTDTLAPASAVADLEKRIAAIGQLGATGESVPVALAEKVTALEATVAALSTRVDGLAAEIEGAAAKPAEAEGAKATLAIAAAALAKSAAAGGSFAPDLALVAALLPDDTDVAALKPFAEKGAPSRADLAARFPEVADLILKATAAASSEDGFWSRLVKGARGLVTIRPVEPMAGATPEAIVSRMDAAMKTGDIAAMLAERDGLPEAGKAASADYAKAASDRAEIDRLVAAFVGRAGAPAAKE
jgi:hypothetical protein